MYGERKMRKAKDEHKKAQNPLWSTVKSYFPRFFIHCHHKSRLQKSKKTKKFAKSVEEVYLKELEETKEEEELLKLPRPFPSGRFMLTITSPTTFTGRLILQFYCDTTRMPDPQHHLSPLVPR